MKQKIYDALINTDISNLTLNCTNKLRMVIRFVDEKIADGDYLMMRSYDLTDRDGNKFYIRCYFPSRVQTITALDVEVIEETYNDSKKVAKEIAFCPMLRVVVPNGGGNGWTEDEYAEILAKEKLQSWTKSEIIDWVMENIEDVMESYEPYDENYD